MKKILMIMTAFSLFCLAVAHADGRPSGQSGSSCLQTFDYSGFTKIDAGGFIDDRGRNENSGILKVIVLRSNSYEVEMKVNDSDYANLFRVEQSGSTLYVKSVRYAKRPSKTPEAVVTIHTPALDELYIRGVANVSTEGAFKADKFTLSVGGASTMSGLTMSANSADLSMNGAANASDLKVVAKNSIYADFIGASDLNGLELKADRIEITNGGANTLKGLDLNAATLKLEMGGSASIRQGKAVIDGGSMRVSGAGGAKFSINVTGDLKVGLSGAANVNLYGTGSTVTLNSSGAARADLSAFECRSVTATLSGSSSTSVYASETLSYDISSAAKLDYYGHPEIVKSKSPGVQAH